MNHQDLLFFEHDFYALRRNIPHLVEKAVSEVDDKRLMESDVDSLVQEIAGGLTPRIPVLNLDGIEVKQDEFDHDYAGDPRRQFLGGSGSVRGTEFHFHVPFDGHAEVFRCIPSTRDFNPPRADVHDQEIVITVRTTQKDSQAVRKQFDDAVQRVELYLGRLRDDAKGLADEVAGNVRNAVEQRRKKRQDDTDMLGDLGFPERK